LVRKKKRKKETGKKEKKKETGKKEKEKKETGKKEKKKETLESLEVFASWNQGCWSEV
jgi:hypothetical protein